MNSNGLSRIGTPADLLGRPGGLEEEPAPNYPAQGVDLEKLAELIFERLRDALGLENERTGRR